MKQLILIPHTKSEAGRKGYQATVKKMGKHAFHSAGGMATARIDGFTCLCHGVGVQAFAQHFPLKGKKHRY